MRLTDSVAVVTGGARGIGAAICAGYAREGARGVVNDHGHRDLAGDLAARIRADGGQAIAVCGDVSRTDNVRTVVAAAHEAFGAVDILVANAAVYPRTPWYDLTEGERDRVMAVSLKGAFLCAQAVYPDMRARHYGKIITVGSVVAELGWGPFLHYVTTKAGLAGFTRSLTREVGKDGIRVNCVMPAELSRPSRSGRTFQIKGASQSSWPNASACHKEACQTTWLVPLSTWHHTTAPL